MARGLAATLLLAPALIDGHIFGTKEWNENLGRELLGWHYDLLPSYGIGSYGRQDEKVDSSQPVGRRLQPAGDGDGAAPAGDGEEAAPAGDGDAEAAPAGDGDGDAAADAAADGDVAAAAADAAAAGEGDAEAAPAGDGDGDAAADAAADGDVAAAAADAAAAGEGDAAADAPADAAAAYEPSMKGDVVTMNIPCCKLNAFGTTWVDAIEPCGPAVEIPGDGLDFTTPFGTYHVPGVGPLDAELEQADNAFSGYTSYITGWFLILYAGFNVSTPAKRVVVREKLNKMKLGHLSGDEKDPMLSPAEVAAAAADKLDPASANFICPGNIYRLVCVMHPGEVGYKQWVQYCVKALICAYMQFYLPYNILTNILRQWHFNGVKSPLYFVMNFASFFSQFAALGNVCNLFGAKCAAVIEGDAQAVHFLCSHTEPAAELLKDEENAARMDAAAVNAPLLASAVSNVERAGAEAKPTNVTPLLGDASQQLDSILNQKVIIPQWIIEYNEFFWCALNIVLTCFSSIVLMVCMFLKVATFEGDIMNIAAVAVSLYFVFDLDDKVMQADPKLKPRYRRIVLKQTEAVLNPPTWIKSVSAHTIQLLDMAIPLGLLGIILISWKGSSIPGGPSIIIGGDPFKQPQ